MLHEAANSVLQQQTHQIVMYSTYCIVQTYSKRREQLMRAREHVNTTLSRILRISQRSCFDVNPVSNSCRSPSHDVRKVVVVHEFYGGATVRREFVPLHKVRVALPESPFRERLVTMTVSTRRGVLTIRKETTKELVAPEKETARQGCPSPFLNPCCKFSCCTNRLQVTPAKPWTDRNLSLAKNLRQKRRLACQNLEQGSVLPCRSRTDRGLRRTRAHKKKKNSAHERNMNPQFTPRANRANISYIFVNSARRT